MSSGGTHLLEYDPALNSWTQKAAFPGTGRYVASAFSIGNNGYVGLGYGSSTTFSDFYKYTPATDSWQQISSMPGSARNSALACVVNNQGIILCGNKGMTTFNDSYVYDPIDDSWDPFISFSAGSRSAMVGGVIGNTIFAGGGGGPGGTSTFTDWQKNETTVGLNKIHRPKSQPRIVRSTSRDWLLEVPLSANKTNEFTICDLSGKQLTKSQIYDTAVWLPEFMDGLYIIYFDNPAWAPIKFIGGR